MKQTIYIVKAGDTIEEISNRHGVDRNVLMDRNNIRESSYIHIGQQLSIPLSIRGAASEEGGFSEFWLYFVDSIGMPIAGLKAHIYAGLHEYRLSTDIFGVLPPIRIYEANVRPRVFIEKLGGGEKFLTELRVLPGSHQFTFHSPRRKIDILLRTHDGIPDTNTHDKIGVKTTGEPTNHRDLGGNPVLSIAAECPNQQNLRLGINDKYRKFIIQAAARAEILPHAVAAMINAEAAKIRVVVEKPVYIKGKLKLKADGSPLTKKKSISTGEWDPRSASQRSSARGMCQFVDATWIGLAVSKSTFLHTKVTELGLFKRDAKGNLTFTLEAGDSKPLTIAALRSHITKSGTANDANIQALLDLRFDAECAIQSMVDYSIQNEKSLISKNYLLKSLNLSERAKLMYATHHLGPRNIIHYINETFLEKSAKSLLIDQVGDQRATDLALAREGDFIAAHRGWLNDYIEQKIVLKMFACDPTMISEGRTIVEIAKAIKGKEGET